MKWGRDYFRLRIMGHIALYINEHALSLNRFWYYLSKKWGMFIDSFDNLAFKLNQSFLQTTSITKLLLRQWSDFNTRQYPNICGFHTCFTS